MDNAQNTLIEEMHRSGINIRHLGLIRKYCTIALLKDATLIEMVARTVKITLRGKWRNKMKKHPSSEAESYKHVCLFFI